jgi:hypothetical protein
MTNEREIDRAIDAAAGAMMTREPSRALAYAVMSRVRDGRAAAPRRFVWVLAAASAVVFGAIATTLMSETRTTVEPIHTHPIVLSSLDVPQLQRETTVIDALNVEPLTIEPLATSND